MFQTKNRIETYMFAINKINSRTIQSYLEQNHWVSQGTARMLPLKPMPKAFFVGPNIIFVIVIKSKL